MLSETSGPLLASEATFFKEHYPYNSDCLAPYCCRTVINEQRTGSFFLLLPGIMMAVSGRLGYACALKGMHVGGRSGRDVLVYRWMCWSSQLLWLQYVLIRSRDGGGGGGRKWL